MFVPCFVVKFLCVFSRFEIILTGKRERPGCFILFVFLVSCDCYCSVALPQGAVGGSAVCDCDIS